jgi:hypothetical protein
MVVKLGLADHCWRDCIGQHAQSGPIKRDEQCRQLDEESSGDKANTEVGDTHNEHDGC